MRSAAANRTVSGTYRTVSGTYRSPPLGEVTCPSQSDRSTQSWRFVRSTSDHRSAFISPHEIRRSSVSESEDHDRRSAGACGPITGGSGDRTAMFPDVGRPRDRCPQLVSWKEMARFGDCAQATLGLVTMERPAPIRSAWVTLRVGALHNAEPHAKGAGHEEGTVCRSRCARGHDRGRRGGAGRDGAVGGGDSESPGIDPQTGEAALDPPNTLRACYEAGPTGYVIYWQLTALGVRCEVVAPTLVPVKAGDRVKTDRRDALKLARSYRAGDLTPVWVPDAAHEALRDVVRAREAAKKDQLRARHRLGKFLLRHGRRPPTGINRWTQRYLLWVKGVRFAEAAQEATLLDYFHEVDHMADRLTRLEADADGDRRAAGAARGRAGIGGHDRGRTRPGLALWPAPRN